MVLILFVLLLYFKFLKDWNLIYVAMILLLSVYDCKFLQGIIIIIGKISFDLCCMQL